MDRDPQPDELCRAGAAGLPEPRFTLDTAEGTVKRWRDEKGTGAIASAATAPWDIWCHFSAIEMPGFKVLAPGERVEVEYYPCNQGSFRYCAHRVRRRGPGPAAGEGGAGAG